MMIMTSVLKENKDFRRIYAKGTSYPHAYLVLYVMKNRRNDNRIGITVNKKLGGAVSRNRMRRILKEGYLLAEPELATGFDFVLVARGRTAVLKSTEITKALFYLFRNAGVLKFDIKSE